MTRDHFQRRLKASEGAANLKCGVRLCDWFAPRICFADWRTEPQMTNKTRGEIFLEAFRLWAVSVDLTVPLPGIATTRLGSYRFRYKNSEW